MANEFKVKKGLIVDGSNTVLDIQGTQGQLFSVTDSLTGDLFSVSDVSGIPILNVNSSGTVDVDGNSTFVGNVQITGDSASPHTDRALTVNRGQDGNIALQVLNSGEVVTNANYFYATGPGVSMYVQNSAVFRGSILNDTANAPVTIGDNLTVTGDIDVTRSTTGEILSRVWNSNTGGSGTAVMRIANSGNQANGTRLEFSDNDYYVATASVDRTNGMRFMVHNDSTSMTDLLSHTALTLATNKNATFAGDITANGSFKWATNGNSFTYSNTDGSGMYIERVGATNALSDIRIQGRPPVSSPQSPAYQYTSLHVKPSNHTIVLNTSGSIALSVNSVQKTTMHGGFESLANSFITTSGTSLLTITGSDNGYVNAGIVLNSTDDDGHARGGGIYMNNVVGQTEWFIGRPYQGADQFQINRRATTTGAHHDATAVAGAAPSGHGTTATLVNITSSGNAEFTGAGTFGGNLTINGPQATFNPDADSSLRILNAGTDAIAIFAAVGDTLYLGGNNTTGMYLDTSANATFAGNLTVNLGQILTPSGVDLSLNPNTGLVNVGGRLNVTGSGISYFAGTINITGTNDLRIDNGSLTSSQSSTTAPVARFTDAGVANYDWTFPDSSTVQLNPNTSSTKTFKLHNSGSGGFNIQASSATFDDNTSATGSAILDVQGSVGQLFSVTNSLSGDLFSVSDVSGIPIFNVNSSGSITTDGSHLTITDGSIHLKQAIDSGFTSGLTIERSANTQKAHIGMDGGAVNFNSPDGLSYKFRNNGTEKFTVDGSGNATFTGLCNANGGFASSASYQEYGNGIGSVTNDGGWNARLNVAGSSHARIDAKSVSDGIITTMYAHSGHAAGRVGTMSNHPIILMTGGQTRGTVATNGSLTMTNDVIAFSDKKLKENIKTLDGSKVLKMRGVSFDRIDTNSHSSGVIAQEIREVAPELVSETDGTLGVAYGNLVGYLIEAVKDQQKQIDELKKLIK